MITADIIKVQDTLSPEIDRIIRGMENTRPLMSAVGGEMAKTLQGHFRSRSGTFWGEIADATALTSFDHNQATVSVSPPQGFYVLHKRDGGTVRPKPPRKFLAIPANDQAKRAGWPSHWSKIGDGKLKVLWGRNGPYALALNQDRIRWQRSGKKSLVTKDGNKGNWGRGVIMYWLKRQVTHKPDPNAVPPIERMRESVRSAIDRYMTRFLKKGL